MATWIVDSTSTGPITLGSTWLQHDAQRRDADHARRLHVLLVALDHRRAAHRARVLHPARQGDGDDQHAEGERVVRRSGKMAWPTPAISSAIRIDGNDSITSQMRMISASIRPPT